MSDFQIPKFFGSPIANQMGAEQLVAANYQNMLTKQAMQDAADEKAGYESAYNAMLKPRQQAAQGEQVESTPAIDALYGAPQPTLQDQPNRLAMPEPPMAPQGSSAAYIQGSQKANALFQKQQFDYYNQNIAPVMQYMIQNGMNKEYQDLKQQLKGTQNPIAGYASFMANAMGDSELPAPGKIENIPMTEELRPILASMTEHNPALKAAVAAIPVGQNFGIKMTGNAISEINEPKLGATGAVKWQRKKRYETDDKGKVWEVTTNFNPNTTEEKEVSRIPLDATANHKRRYSRHNDAGVLMDSWTGKLIYPERDAKGNISYSGLSAEEATDLGVGAKTQYKATSQVAGPKTAALDRGLELFRHSAPKLISLKETLSQKDRQRLLPLVTGSKTWNEFSAKLENAVVDNPDLADLQKSTTLLADSLAAVYGAGPGGQWSFEVAKAMLDPNMGKESFKRTLDSHEDKLKNSLSAAKSFGSRLPSAKDVRKTQVSTAQTHQVGGTYLGKKIVRLGTDSATGKRYAQLEGVAKPVEIK